MHLLVITEAIMDLHQRIDSIATIASSTVMSDPAKVAYAFQQVTKEIIVSKFLISATFFAAELPIQDCYVYAYLQGYICSGNLATPFSPYCDNLVFETCNNFVFETCNNFVTRL